ncbi:MAG: bifunctional (p)ppGpp synthetase/guanosine-3',5'-bis(diphosphate) 3'-pyrophosphohydrolase [Bacteroidales bacterium]|nr:bifunctional (p)ppGpp synthetase/guanosine-3',5'-bis(diphosphate) 3'-pyrophosphohydrolase [Bacteroidales bacterium]
MAKISEFTEQDFKVIADEYAILKESALKRCGDQSEIDTVQKAFDFANEAHKGVRRRSGEPYILHPIAVARIVVEDIGLGCKSIAAALLHDVVEDTEYTTEDIKNLFGEKIASLVDGLTKIKTVLDKNARADQMSMQAENFKRILLTLNDDIRVVLIKLADRLHNCRTIEFMPEFKRDKILSETMFIFIPLAHRLGLYEVKSEMENIWLRYKEPVAFAEITESINASVNDKIREIDDFIAPIHDALEDAGFKFHIKKRVKTPYSIWNKMRTKNVTFDQIYDLYAVRIVFESDLNASERDQCYHIFSIITGIYRYKPDRVRDWVKEPKNNGYEALHCTLMSSSGIWIEVQIRTQRMDDIAEKGIAAHWTYKQNGFVSENISEMDLWINKIKEILVNPDVNALELLDIIHNDLTTTDIFVFTPKGDQRRIIKGATALDFAYMIHTHIGNKAIAAKVNMKLVPLSYQLRQGDQVEIITAENENPSADWLHFLRTRKARNVVLDYLKQDRSVHVADGAKILKEKVEAAGYKMDNSMLSIIMDNYEAYGNADELYFRIGIGLTSLDNLEDVLKTARTEESKGLWSFSWLRQSHKNHTAPSAPVVKQKEELVITNDPASRYKYIFATCCNPIPGDNVLGFLSSDNCVTVHKKSCHTANSIAAKHGDRIVLPKWNSSEFKSFLVRISIKGIDRLGMISDITRYISFVMSVNIRRFHIDSDDGIFEGYIDLYVHDKDVLDKLIKRLGKIEGMSSVTRTDLE